MKKSINVILVFVVCIFFCNCITQKTIIGEYRYKENGQMIWTLNLNNDGTFLYKFNFGFFNRKSSGVWNVKGNNLILKSDISNMRQIPIDVIEKYDYNFLCSNFFIDFNTKIPDSLINICIYVNDSSKYEIKDKKIHIEEQIDNFCISLQLSNKVSFPSQPIDSIFSEKYYIKNHHNNVYHISLKKAINNDDIFFYKIINDTLKIRKNYLIWGKEKIVMGDNVGNVSD